MVRRLLECTHLIVETLVIEVCQDLSEDPLHDSTNLADEIVLFKKLLCLIRFLPLVP